LLDRETKTFDIGKDVVPKENARTWLVYYFSMWSNLVYVGNYNNKVTFYYLFLAHTTFGQL